jgi:hypothetical protein
MVTAEARGTPDLGNGHDQVSVREAHKVRLLTSAPLVARL